MASKKEKKITIDEVRNRYSSKLPNAQKRGVWLTGFLDRVFSLHTSPYRSASKITMVIWNAGWAKADELINKGYEFHCCSHGGPLVPDENRSRRIRYQQEFLRGRRFL